MVRKALNETLFIPNDIIILCFNLYFTTLDSKSLESETIHRFGSTRSHPNSFKLHGLPIPRQNQVLGLAGPNGIGKSTALKLLAGKTNINLGNFQVTFYFYLCTLSSNNKKFGTLRDGKIL